MKHSVKTILAIAITAASLFTLKATAAQQQVSVEGLLTHTGGYYRVISADSNTIVRTLHSKDLQPNLDEQVRITGEQKSKYLEVYKIEVKEQDGYKKSYDWDEHNQDDFES